MAPTRKDLGIDRLIPADRIALAQEIRDSVAADAPPAGLTSEQAAELDRRDAELDANPEMALTWEQIKASVRGGR